MRVRQSWGNKGNIMLLRQAYWTHGCVTKVAPHQCMRKGGLSAIECTNAIAYESCRFMRMLAPFSPSRSLLLSYLRR